MKRTKWITAHTNRVTWTCVWIFG